GRPRRAIALERLAVQAALGEDVAQQHRGGALRRAPGGGPAQLGRGEVEQALGDVVAREVQGIAGDALAGGRGRRRQLGEQLVERRRIERELARELVTAHLGGELGRDRDGGVLVLQVDRERKLLRHVER